MKFRYLIGAALVAAGLANGAQAQFMSAAEVKPILGMTKGNWVAVRAFNGQDLLYFTHLMSFRCGLEEVMYGINGEPASISLPMEPCHEGTSAPMAMDPVAFPPYVAFPAGSVHSVNILMMYDDGDIEEATFERAEIQM